MKNSAGIIVAFLGGALIGAALGVIFAPESGEETRMKILNELEKYGIKLNGKETDDEVNEVNSTLKSDVK
jgi:gas vesicle protein